MKIIAQPFEKNYALAKAVIDINNNYMWTSQEIARGRIKYRLWGLKIMGYCILITFLLVIIIFYILYGFDGFIFFNDLGVKILVFLFTLIFLFIGWRVGASFDEKNIELEAILLKLGFNRPTMISLYDFSVFKIKYKNTDDTREYGDRWAMYTYRIDLAQKADAEKYGKK